MSTTANHPDTIILAGRVHTFTEKPATAQAIALRAGRIVAVGTKKKILELNGRGTRTIDLGESVVTPGLVDSHTHFFYWAIYRSFIINLETARNRDEALAMLKKQSKSKRVCGWVLGVGFDYNPWESGVPTARDLDEVLPEAPAIIRSRDLHTAWLNTAALERTGITAYTPDPKGGRFSRDAQGNPTGIVQETAIKELPDPMGEFTSRTDANALKRIDAALDDAYAYARSFGLTGVHSMDDASSLKHLQRHHRDRRLGLRFVHGIQIDQASAAGELGLRTGLGDDWLRLGGIKIFSDGTLGSQTAYMFDDYPGREGYSGVPVIAGEDLRGAVINAAHLGFPVWIHAIGDRAVHESLSAITAARRFEERKLPHRIEHTQCIRPADIKRMAKAGVIASVQPCHLLGDIDTADRHWPKSRKNAFAFRRMLDAGVMLALGSDLPIESLDPRRSLFAAVVRTDESGSPAGGWFPEQAITVREALAGFTVGAHASVNLMARSERRPPGGMIAPGGLADLTFWEKDPLKVKPETLLEIGITGCMIDGAAYMN